MEANKSLFFHRTVSVPQSRATFHNGGGLAGRGQNAQPQRVGLYGTFHAYLCTKASEQYGNISHSPAHLYGFVRFLPISPTSQWSQDRCPAVRTSPIMTCPFYPTPACFLPHPAKGRLQVAIEKSETVSLQMDNLQQTYCVAMTPEKNSNPGIQGVFRDAPAGCIGQVPPVL